MDLPEMIKSRINLPNQDWANTQVVINGKRAIISMVAHWRAYQAYALLFGSNQSYIRISERGGFGEEELNAFYPEWKNHIRIDL